VSSVPARGNTWQLVLATGAFAVCFAVFGSVSAMMPIMRKHLGFTSMQVSTAIALPILLGSLGRVPLGILTDRFGGRIVFSIVMAISILPALLIGAATTYTAVLVYGFLIGLALASFSVGVAFTSGWYPPERQGAALGVYGAGNIGQSLAAYGSPLLAGAFGYVWGYRTFAILLSAWLVLFLLFARNSPRPRTRKSLADVLRPLRRAGSWELSFYYFLTFGGFVAMAVYLPTFLTDMFGLTPRDAGFRTAGFVVLATAMRPVGGWIADRAGGRRVLVVVFLAVALWAIFLSFRAMVPFTLGALGMAASIGLGNGAVFKLVPEYFPNDVGSVTGLVGAAGGLGGFFPPLVLGALRQHFGAYTPGFALLGCYAVLAFVLARPKVWALCLVPPEPGTRLAPCSRLRFCLYAGECTTKPR
jgi:NNP family nitrate/nitrite transporter-like MFS transporter